MKKKRNKFLSLFRMLNPYRAIKKREFTRALRIVSLGAAAALVCFIGGASFLYLTLFAPPGGFPQHSVFSVKEGSTVGEIAARLKEDGYINSSMLFTLSVRLFDGEHSVPSGEYYFADRESVFEVANRLAAGDYGVESIKVTIPEGVTKFTIANVLEKKLPGFNKREFLETAAEGYLFPETYYFRVTDTTDKVIERMNDEFMDKISELSPLIGSFDHSLHELVTMASIVEEEASKSEDRRVIAGILWKRLEEGMPLQVDVTLRYVTGRNSYQLTLADLDDASPYNTYKHAGLPPTPISNPGFDALEATIRPASTDYWFFLSDRSGNTYFSETYDEHRVQKRKYVN